MKRASVTSSNVRSIGYNSEARVLEVEFNTGKVYHYLDVSPFIWNKLTSTKSIGKFMNSQIKPKYKVAHGEYIKPNTESLPNLYLCSKAGGGKTITAEFLQKVFGYRQAKFAGPIYGIARDYFGMTNKDRNLLQTIGTNVGRDILDEDIWIKRFVEDIRIVEHTKSLLGIESQPFVIDDCRFMNEHTLLKKAGWVGVHLFVSEDVRLERLKVRDGKTQLESLTHKAELDLDSFKDDLITVDSDGDRELVFEEVVNIIRGKKLCKVN